MSRLTKTYDDWCGFKLHVVFYVAGTRMIAQGTDGVSRGFLALGVMAGESMSMFIPIHKSVHERSREFLCWITLWAGQESLVLTTEDWVGKGHAIAGWEPGSDGFD